MSLASFLNSNDDIQFSEINCGTINANIVNATVINGGSGGSGVNITSSDNTLTITNGKGTVDLTNAGQNWSKFPSIAQVDMNGNMFKNLATFQFTSFTTAKNLSVYQGYTNATGLSGIYLTDGGLGAGGNVGNIYDSYYNKPTMSDIIQGSGVSGMPITLNSDGSVTLTTNGVLKVTNGSVTGRVFDNTIYKPSAISSNPIQYRQQVSPSNYLAQSWTYQGSNGFTSYIVQLPCSNYPNACHFVLDVLMLTLTSNEGSGSFGGLSLWLTDSQLMPIDETKSVSSVRLPTGPFTNNSNVVWTPPTGTNWTLEYVNTVAPVNLYLFVQTLQTNPILGNVNLISNLTADNVFVKIVPDFS